MIAVLLLAACGNQDGPGSVTSHWSEYAGLEEGAAWSWREAGAAEDTGSADIATAIRGRHTGDGYVELRLGDPWADASALGFLQWDTTDGIALSAWTIGGASGDTPRTFVPDGTEPGETVSADGFSCLVTIPAEPRVVYYASFDDVVQAECEGDDALAGLWVFARGHGLVYVSSGVAEWEFIAPL